MLINNGSPPVGEFDDDGYAITNTDGEDGVTREEDTTANMIANDFV